MNSDAPRRLTFLLPGPATTPVGGYKVVFEYANRAARDGFLVQIVLPATLLWKERGWLRKLEDGIRYPLGQLSSSVYRPDSWFALEPSVRVHWVPSLEERYVPDGDVIFATACETAEYVNDYSVRKGTKYYLIQHFEEWYFSRERLLRTWRYPLRKVVIADWLEKIATNLGETSTLIANGLDFERFGLDLAIASKNPRRIAMLYHQAAWKGAAIGLAAIEQVRRAEPGVEVALFGATRRPMLLPRHIRYHHRPPQRVLREIYNTSGIFVGPSFGEGWGLTVSEAMQCGCAVACTQANGHDMVAFHEVTALLSEPGNADALAKNILRLIREPELRVRIAEHANRFVQQFTWNAAYSKLRALVAAEPC